MQKSLSSFLRWSTRTAGRPISFVIALIVLLLWLLWGIIFGYSEIWLLTIDTLATINASLMVFIIQHSQIRESKALHLKIDELIYAVHEAQNELIAIEDMDEEELERIRTRLKERRKTLINQEKDK